MAVCKVYHVDGYDIVDNYARFFPEIDEKKWLAAKTADTYILYTLGPAIVPMREVRNGRIFGPGHQKAAIDLLLTSATIEEAVQLTKQRLAQVQ